MPIYLLTLHPFDLRLPVPLFATERSVTQVLPQQPRQKQHLCRGPAFFPPATVVMAGMPVRGSGRAWQHRRGMFPALFSFRVPQSALRMALFPLGVDNSPTCRIMMHLFRRMHEGFHYKTFEESARVKIAFARENPTHCSRGNADRAGLPGRQEGDPLRERRERHRRVAHRGRVREPLPHGPAALPAIALNTDRRRPDQHQQTTSAMTRLREAAVRARSGRRCGRRHQHKRQFSNVIMALELARRTACGPWS